MKLIELFEKAKTNKLSIPVEKPRDRNAAALATKSGKGRHKPSDAENIKKGKFRDLKHKGKDLDEEVDE
jgi:hypothetical protein